MITLNVFAELFDWDEKTTERAERAGGAVRSLYTLARVGKSAASPLMFVEAGMAVLDDTFRALGRVTDEPALRRYEQMHAMIDSAQIGLYRPYPDPEQRERIALI